METLIKQMLQANVPRELAIPSRRPAAVLAPLYYHAGAYGVLFTKRSDTVYHHRGQISFPGGGYEPQDASLQETALRESAEEIGLQPAHVTILGQLDDLLTNNSNYVVRPFVGTIPYPYPFELDRRETAYLIEVPLRFLRQHNPPCQETRVHEGHTVQSFFFDYDGHVIWGATAKILKQFLDLLDRYDMRHKKNIPADAGTSASDSGYGNFDTRVACSPFGPWTASYSTSCPSSRDLNPSSSIAEKCTKISASPGCSMKP